MAGMGCCDDDDVDVNDDSCDVFCEVIFKIVFCLLFRFISLLFIFFFEIVNYVLFSFCCGKHCCCFFFKFILLLRIYIL